MSSFALECGNEVVDNLSFLEWDEKEIVHGFLCGVAFDEGIFMHSSATRDLLLRYL